VQLLRTNAIASMLRIARTDVQAALFISYSRPFCLFKCFCDGVAMSFSLQEAI
jgi:hypothetical protein